MKNAQELEIQETIEHSDESINLEVETDSKQSETPEIVQEAKEVLNPEEQLKDAIEKMESSIAQVGQPDFKTFWSERKRSVDLFKENITPIVKSACWEKYRELTKEATRLKDIFREESAFATEQIEIAIQSLETELNQLQTQLQKTPVPQLPENVRALKDNFNAYQNNQRELNYLNTYATRINALRKELIKTEMRIRQKNLLFKRMSALGDLVFPRRKDLIKEISNLFIDDVNDFVKRNFSGASFERSLHPYREDIKSLQAAAKLLTLNAKAFAHSRKTLSDCWDKLKEADKEQKKAFSEKKQIFEKNAELVTEKIQAFTTLVSEGDLSVNEAKKQHEEIEQFMRSQELGRDEVRTLKDSLSTAFQPIAEKIKEEENLRIQKDLEKKQERKNAIQTVENRIEEVKGNLENLSYVALSTELKTFDEEIKALKLTTTELRHFKQLLVPIKDSASDKEDEQFMQITDDAKESIKQLKKVLQRRLLRRQEIKQQIDKYRKSHGSSGLDFEQSLHFNEQINIEKDRLDKINESVAETEAEIAKLRK